MEKANCANQDLVLNIKSKRKPRFKAGADLSTHVNRLDVDFNHDITDEAEVIEVKLHLTSELCEQTRTAPCAE